MFAPCRTLVSIMRIRLYILTAVCALLLAIGSTDVAWLCIRTDGTIGFKVDSGTPCESACSGELGNQVENIPVAVPNAGNFCRNIAFGLDDESQPAKPARPKKAGASLGKKKMRALCARAVPIAVELGVPTQLQSHGSDHLSLSIRKVVLLI
jgi:hypothetical protein